MNGAGPRYDAIVVGGGLAGLTAARDLACAGRTVLLLEARERLGGRVHAAAFPGTDVTLELGGAYISTSNRSVARELQRYGIPFAPAAAPQTYRHLLGDGVIEHPVPIAPEEVLAFERASKHVLGAAGRLARAETLERADVAGLDVPWREFLDAIELDGATRDLFDTWVTAEAGRDPSELSALSPLWTTAQLGTSIANWQLVLDSTIGGGSSALLDAMVRDGRFELRTGTPVARIAHDDYRVEVTTADGERLTAASCVVAVPVNCWEGIEFDPILGEDKRRGAALRPDSHGVKGWALVADAPPAPGGLAAVRPGRSLALYGTEARVGEDQLVMIFSVPTGPGGAGVIDVNDPHAVQRELEQILPGCRVLASHGDDLRADPFSRGSWASYVPGLVRHLGGMRAPEGRLAFAGADIARGFIMWIDGAIESGGDAAQTVARILESGVAPGGAAARAAAHGPARTPREIVEGQVAALLRRDLDGVAAHFTEDCVLVDMARPHAPHRGRAGIVAYCASLVDGRSELEIELHSVVGDGAWLAAEMEVRGRDDAGAPLVQRFCVVDELAGGLVRREHVYWNSTPTGAPAAVAQSNEGGRR